MARDCAAVAVSFYKFAALRETGRRGPYDREQPGGDEAAAKAERGQAVQQADQAVQLHPQLPRAQAGLSDRRRSGEVPPDRTLRDRPAQMGSDAMDRPVLEGRQAVSHSDIGTPWVAGRRARQQLW